MPEVTNHYQATLALEALHTMIDGPREGGIGHVVVVGFAGSMTAMTTRLRLVLGSDADVSRLAAAIGFQPSRTKAGVWRARGPWLGGTLTIASARKLP